MIFHNMQSSDLGKENEDLEHHRFERVALPAFTSLHA